jgi:hypothetical protein
MHGEFTEQENKHLNENQHPKFLKFLKYWRLHILVIFYVNYVSHISYFYRKQPNIFQSTMLLLLLHCKKGLPFSHPLPGCH